MEIAPNPVNKIFVVLETSVSAPINGDVNRRTKSSSIVIVQLSALPIVISPAISKLRVTPVNEFVTTKCGLDLIFFFVEKVFFFTSRVSTHTERSTLKKEQITET